MPRVRHLLTLLALTLLTVLNTPLASQAMDVVPAGNRNAEQPNVPGASVRRTKAGKTSFDAKYEKVRDLLASAR